MFSRICIAIVVVACLFVLPDQSMAAAGSGGHSPIGAEGVSEDPSEIKTDLAIHTVIVFLLLFAILARFAWGPISSGLEKREEGIRQNIADAESARVKAEQLLADHEKKLAEVQGEVQEIIAEARRDAEQTKNDIITQAQTEAETTQKRAIDEIERARDHALKELFDTMSNNVLHATEHVLGRTLDDGDQNRLIDEALAQLPDVSRN